MMFPFVVLLQCTYWGRPASFLCNYHSQVAQIMWSLQWSVQGNKLLIASLKPLAFLISELFHWNHRFQPKAQDQSPGTAETQTPLLNAARNGHDEIVAYLLQFSKVSTQLKRQPENVGSASVSYSYMYTCICLQCHIHLCSFNACICSKRCKASVLVAVYRVACTYILYIQSDRAYQSSTQVHYN